MNCVCYNIINNIQRQIANLLSTAAMNRINSDSSSTDDGAYQPNLHLLDKLSTPLSSLGSLTVSLYGTTIINSSLALVNAT